MKIIDLTNETNVRFTIPFEDSDITMEVKFLDVVQMWICNIFYEEQSFYGLKLACGSTMLRARNLPFDFYLVNNLNNGFDPFLDSDFSDESYTLYLIERDEITELRGYEVP